MMTGINNQKGFLMVEVIIATVIITIALVAATGMFIQSTRANSDADQYTVATGLAQKQLELLKQQNTSYWAGITSSQLIIWQGEEIQPVMLNNVRYTIVTTAQPCPEDSVNLIQVTVTVTWNTKTMTVTNFYSKI